MKRVKILSQTRYDGQPVKIDEELPVDDKTAERWEEKNICEILEDTESAIDSLKAKADELEINYAHNISAAKLQEKINAKIAELEAKADETEEDKPEGE